MRRAWLITILLGVVVAVLAPRSQAQPSPGAREDAAPLIRQWGATKITSLDPPSSTPAAAPIAPAGAPAAPPAKRLPADQVLSNEWTFTRWANPGDTAFIRSGPGRGYGTITRLHWYTEDGFPEVYLVLRAHWDTHGQEWIEVRIPMRPNGRVGWVRRQDLEAFHLTHLLILVDRKRMLLRLYNGGRAVWSAPVGVGAPGTPTPAGHFWIRERFKIADRASGYWPYAFGTSDYSTLTDWPGGGVVGIHGPYFAQSEIPGHISHGCIRLRTSDDAWLAHHITLGTPVHVI
jgi:hypothetical protein